MDDLQEKALKRTALEVRKDVVRMIGVARSGYVSSSLSVVDILVYLYWRFLNISPEEPRMRDRDRLILSKGHACSSLYAVLANRGFFDREELWNFRRLGSMLQGHPDRHTPGVEVCSGSLGQGLSVALGMSLAARIDKKDYRVYVLMGDGEIQEGNIWEAAMASSHYKCDNLCAILDYNGFQVDGATNDIMNLEPVAKKWQAFGWHTIEIDGHNMQQILLAYDEAKRIKGKPTIIVARTVKGKGVSFMENTVEFHGRAPTVDETEKALKELS